MVNRLPAYKKEDTAFVRKLLRVHGSTTAQIRELMDPTSTTSHQQLMTILSEISEKVSVIGQEKVIEFQPETLRTHHSVNNEAIAHSESVPYPAVLDTPQRTLTQPIEQQKGKYNTSLLIILKEVLVELQQESGSIPRQQNSPDNKIDIEILTALHTRLFSAMRDFKRFQNELLKNPDPGLPSTFDGWVFFSIDPNKFLRLLGDICGSKKYGESAMIADVIRIQVIPMLQQDPLCLTKVPCTIQIGARSITLTNTYDIYKVLGEGGVQLFTHIIAKVNAMKMAHIPEIVQPTAIVPITREPSGGDVRDSISLMVPDVPPDNIHRYIARKPANDTGIEMHISTTHPEVISIVSRLRQYFQEHTIVCSISSRDFGVNAFKTPYLMTNIEPERYNIIQAVLTRWKAENDNIRMSLQGAHE